MILGFSSIVNPLTISYNSLIDMIVMVISGILVYVFALKDQKITKPRGIVMLILYFSYVAYLLVR